MQYYCSHDCWRTAAGQVLLNIRQCQQFWFRFISALFGIRLQPIVVREIICSNWRMQTRWETLHMFMNVNTNDDQICNGELEIFLSVITSYTICYHWQWWHQWISMLKKAKWPRRKPCQLAQNKNQSKKMLQYQKIRCAGANEMNECGKIPSVCRDKKGREMQTLLNEFRIKFHRRSRAINIFAIVQFIGHCSANDNRREGKKNKFQWREAIT